MRLYNTIFKEQCKDWHDPLLKLFSQFTRSYKSEPKFSILVLSSLAHYNPSALYSVDQQFFSFFAQLENEASIYANQHCKKPKF